MLSFKPDNEEIVAQESLCSQKEEILQNMNYFNEDKAKNNSSTYFVYKREKRSRICYNSVDLALANSSLLYLKKPITSNFHMVKNSNVYLNNIVDCLESKRKMSLFSAELSTNSSSLLSDKTPSTSVVNDTSQPSVYTQYPIDSKQSVTPTSCQISKEDFFQMLNLIPLEKYDEIISRKNVRKQRTTANPQFSSAALEAKRVTKLELLEERKNRRLEREKALKINKCQLALKDADYTKYKKLVTENLPSSSNFSLVKRTSNLKYCKICKEPCQCHKDVTLMCKTCKLFFHQNCITSKPCFNIQCPNCDVFLNYGSMLKEHDGLSKRLYFLQKLILNTTENVSSLRHFYKSRINYKTKLIDDHKKLTRKVQRIKNLFFSIENEKIIQSGGGGDYVHKSFPDDNVNMHNQISCSDSSSNSEYYDLEATIPYCDNDMQVVTFCA